MLVFILIEVQRSQVTNIITRKWNISDHKYGQPWVSGDVIGCYADLDSGKISFSRNGADMGVAFSNIR